MNWLAKWRENIEGKIRYMELSAASMLKVGDLDELQHDLDFARLYLQVIQINYGQLKLQELIFLINVDLVICLFIKLECYPQLKFHGHNTCKVTNIYTHLWRDTNLPKDSLNTICLTL